MGRYVVSTYIGHDASMAIVGEGRILHYEMERFSRAKHDGGSVDHYFDLMLADLGIDREEVVASVSLSGSMGSGPTSSGWTDHNEVYEGRTMAFKNGNIPLLFVPHHTAHAAYAFYTSPYENARLVAMDGGGDCFRLPFLGKWSTDATVGSASHAFGSDERQFDSWWHPCLNVGGMWIKASDDIFGVKYAEGKVMALEGIAVDQFQVRTGLDPATHAEVKAMQRFTNRVISEVVPRHPVNTPVCLAGGVALNGIGVYELLKQSDVPAVWVPPAVHDGGLTIGGAMYALHRLMGEPRYHYSPSTVAFCGYMDRELVGELPAERIVHDLIGDKVVALAYGRAESGPRALGHRSLLANPTTPGIKDRINRMKGRDLWRPVAPVVLREDAERLFDLINPDCYHFMTTIAAATDECRAKYPAAIHDDGSARVQVVDRDHILGGILWRLKEATGCKLLLNTSFNSGGEAMVNTAVHARDTASRIRPDTLVCGETVEDVE